MADATMRKFIDCREFPSESNCTVTIMADNADELVEAAAQHAVAVHKHEDTPALREGLKGLVRSGAPPDTRPRRAHYCMPYVVVHRALKGMPIRINAADAVGDQIHALDVSRAIMTLLDKDGPLDHEVYNIASGGAVSVQHLLETVAEIIPGTQWRVAEPAECDIIANPAFKGGRWGAYDISRISNET